MSTQHRVRIASLENQAFALMSRMHVILRRQNNRITDVEYMRIDPAYCRHLLDLAAQSADEDLHRIVEKLEEIYFGKEGLFVLTLPKPSLLERQDKTPLQATPSSSPVNIDTTQLSSPPSCRASNRRVPTSALCAEFRPRRSVARPVACLP